MGSKRSLAPSIAARISSEYPSRPVLDVFAGMCAVGNELASSHAVLTNDIHRFAHTVASALFVERADCPTSIVAREELLKNFRTNRDALRAVMHDRIVREWLALSKCDEPAGWRLLAAMHNEAMEEGYPLSKGFEKIELFRQDARRFPYNLFSRYFSNGYFGVEQALEIDSLRYAIDHAPPEHRNHYLTALLRAASHCATAPGHFAQFLEPRGQSKTRYIARIRLRSLVDRFLNALDSFVSPTCLDRDQNAAFNQDATDLICSLAHSRTDAPVIYADPPYSRAQYSRYYHVLETLVLYDYPECTGKGRYRHDRFQTGFSQTGKVVQTFSAFIKACSEIEAPLYISYPSNGLLRHTGADVLSSLMEHYSSVTLLERAILSHSTLGGAPGVASIPVYEEIYHAKPS